MTRVGTALGTALGRALGTDVTQVEVPLGIPGLKAWFDTRSDDYFTFSSGSSISAWLSRAGSMGAITFGQATSGSQPTRATGVAVLNGKQAVQFDGAGDYMDSSTQNGWKFMSDGSGGTYFMVLHNESTAGTQLLMQNATPAADVGFYHDAPTSSTTSSLRWLNGSGTTLNSSNPAHAPKDVPRWQAVSYSTNALSSYASGVALANSTDTAGQAPSASNPTRALRLGAYVGPGNYYKGYIAQLLFYDHVLSSAERQALAEWAAREYGWAILDGTTGFDGVAANYMQSGSGVGNTNGGYWTAALVKMDSQPSGARYALRSVTASAGFLLGCVSSAGTLRFGCYWNNAGTPAFASSPVYNVQLSDYGKIKLLVGVNEGSALKFYLDGVQIGTATAFANYLVPSDTNRLGERWDCGAIFGAAGGHAVPTAQQVSAFAAAVKAAGRMVVMPGVQTDHVWNTTTGSASVDEVAGAGGTLAVTGALSSVRHTAAWGW